tara:strand:+ start:427 stop:552 length:126 start_codon:yes stop_codon:yes gene_type:complete
VDLAVEVKEDQLQLLVTQEEQEIRLLLVHHKEIQVEQAMMV